MRYFEFTDIELMPGVYRIRATQNLERRDVRHGDLGGWVSTDATLTGGSWVYPGAIVAGGAMLGHESTVKERATVRGNAVLLGSTVSGESVVEYDALVVNSIIDGKSYIWDDAVVVNSLVRDSTMWDRARAIECSLWGGVTLGGTVRARNAEFTEGMKLLSNDDYRVVEVDNVRHTVVRQEDGSWNL